MDLFLLGTFGIYVLLLILIIKRKYFSKKEEIL